MPLFRHREDRLPVFLICVLFVLDLAVFATVDSPWLLVGWTLFGIYPKGWICAWNHHHQHLATFVSPLPNRLLETIYGLHTGLTSHAWTLHHVLGHHKNYLDQTKDESRWQEPDGSTMGVMRYTFVVALTAYPRAWVVSRQFPRYRRVFVAGIVTTLGLLAAGFAVRPLQTLFVFALPMVMSLLVTAWATYTHHAGRPVEGHFEASTNIMSRVYNVLTGNLGYHTAHHYRAGVHWSKLPALHETIRHRIPADAYLQPGFPFSWGQPIDTQATQPSPVRPATSLEPRSAQREPGRQLVEFL